MTAPPVPLDTLLAYLAGELPPEEELALEDRLFADEGLARQLEDVARLAADVRALVRGGGLGWVGATVEALERLAREGTRVRTYRVPAGGGVACTVAGEDLVAIRLAGDFHTDVVDLRLEARFEDGEAREERLEDVPVDVRTGEVVLLYAGDRIRALPRSWFRYRVRRGDETLAFDLDHTPGP